MRAEVAREWNNEQKVSTLITDRACNLIATARQRPFEHIPCIAHTIHRAIKGIFQNSIFDNASAKCRKHIGNVKHRLNTMELQPGNDKACSVKPWTSQRCIRDWQFVYYTI